MIYEEDYWMTDTPHGREFVLTYCGGCSSRYMVRQWDPKFGWYPKAEEEKVYWRPLPMPPDLKNKDVELMETWIGLLKKKETW